MPLRLAPTASIYLPFKDLLFSLSALLLCTAFEICEAELPSFPRQIAMRVTVFCQFAINFGLVYRYICCYCLGICTGISERCKCVFFLKIPLPGQ